MSQVLISLSTWLHALATVIFIGYFVLLALIYLPVLSQPGNGSLLSSISKRSRPWMYISLAIFAVTGIYLMNWERPQRRLSILFRQTLSVQE